MNDPICTDKDDRPRSNHNPKSPQFSLNSPIFRKKWLILAILFLIILLLSFFIIKPQKTEPAQEQSDLVIKTDENGQEYTTLTPPVISRDATQTQQETSQRKERIEISGEITDLLSQKINEINQNDKQDISVSLKNENNYSDPKTLTLQQTMEDDHFTIQIAASSSLETIMYFVKQNGLKNYQIYETNRDKKSWFILIQGNYATHDDAKKALTSLPNSLKNNNPWIKKGNIVNKEKQHNAN